MTFITFIDCDGTEMKVFLSENDCIIKLEEENGKKMAIMLDKKEVETLIHLLSDIYKDMR